MVQKAKLLPFKKGAFQMAVMAQVPIIPVVFSPYYFIDRKKHIFDTGKQTILFVVIVKNMIKSNH